MRKAPKRSRLERLLDHQKVVYSQINSEDREEAQEAWRHTYSRTVFDAHGIWTLRGFDWETFGPGLTPVLTGDGAWNEYRRLAPQEYLILPNFDEDRAYICSAGGFPQLYGKRVDAYICPRGMEWTMVFTHEHFGPYFCTRELAETGAS